MISLNPEGVTTLLNAATVTGAGSAYANPERRNGGAFTNFTWQAIVSGGPSAISTTLQVSLDGVNWTTADTSTNVAGETRQLANWPAAFFRANLGTLTGGTAPTVTVLIQPGG